MRKLRPHDQDQRDEAAQKDLIVSAIRPDGTIEYVDLRIRRRHQQSYDALGPLARAVIDESPIDIDVPLLLVAFRERPRDIRDYDKPPAPADQQLADFLRDAIRHKVPGFEPIRRRHASTADRESKVR